MYQPNASTTLATVTLNYDTGGRQTQLTESSASNTLTAVTAYDSASRVTGITQRCHSNGREECSASDDSVSDTYPMARCAVRVVCQPRCW
jgi:hypothetical protein